MWLQIFAVCVAYELAGRRLLGAGRRALAARSRASSPAAQPDGAARVSACCPATHQARDPYDPAPRQDHLSWDEYFMAVAFLSASRSKDPNKQVGACIVDRKKIILGIGYNGFPRGCPDCALSWAKQSSRGELGTKYPYVVHAEANALLNTNHADLTGSTVYVTMFPCNECAKLVIQAGCREVVFHEDKLDSLLKRSGAHACEVAGVDNKRTRSEAYQAARTLFDMTGVSLRQFRLPSGIVRM